jgi:hypothetical protein
LFISNIPRHRTVSQYPGLLSQGFIIIAKGKRYGALCRLELDNPTRKRQSDEKASFQKDQYLLTLVKLKFTFYLLTGF